MPRLSIIIPTHNRAGILRQTLMYLEAQTIAQELEVIVINDVPNDKEYERVAHSSWHIPIHFETVPPCHQGAARNAGVRRAQASTCLFLGDDMYAHPDMCEKHLVAISNFKFQISNCAVLGYSTWDPALTITPVMKWLEESGWQFGYPKLKAYEHDVIPEALQHQFTYSSHISLPTEVAKRHPFREDVKLYGWEDIEWGMRLRQSGVRVFYEPDAVALHHHHLALEDSLKRMETLGKSAAMLDRLVPEFDRLPKGWKKRAYQLCAVFPTMAGRHRAAFLRGISSAEACINA